MLTIMLSLSGMSAATRTHGTMAVARVTTARAHSGRRMWRKPSMTYCPVNVVVMALDWPAARRASPHRMQPPLRYSKYRQKSVRPTLAAVSGETSGS